MDVWRRGSVQIMAMRLVLVVRIVFRVFIMVLVVVIVVLVVRGLVVVLMVTGVCHRVVPVVVRFRVVRVFRIHGSHICRCLRNHLNRLGVDVDLGELIIFYLISQLD